MDRYRYFGRNRLGRDIGVGDIHGYYAELEEELIKIGFDKTKDRLFVPGDLVDRGPQSHMASRFLSQSWAFSTMGNHDHHVQAYDDPQSRWMERAGKWFQNIPPHLQSVWGWKFGLLPWAMEVEVEGGRVGFVHAECPEADWDDLVYKLHNWKKLKPDEKARYKQVMMHQRKRLQTKDTSVIANVKAVIVGHAHVPQVTVLGNTYYIDTKAGTDNGRFTFIDLNTLQVIKRK